MQEDIKPGTKVRIVRDIRKDAINVSGQIGVYEGEAVTCVRVMDAGEWKELRPEVLEAAWFQSRYPKCDKDFWNQLKKRTVDDPCPSLAEPMQVVSAWYKKHQVRFHYLDTSPTIRLNDGTCIFGYQCWWNVVEEDTNDNQTP